MILAWHGRARGTTLSLIAVTALLAGCAATTTDPAATANGPVAPISDPIVAFAASSGPGAEETVTLAQTGQAVRLRLVRAYAAASGRECREVQIGAGGGSATRLFCGAGTGWREARPLIRDATGRP